MEFQVLSSRDESADAQVVVSFPGGAPLNMDQLRFKEGERGRLVAENNFGIQYREKSEHLSNRVSFRYYVGRIDRATNKILIHETPAEVSRIQQSITALESPDVRTHHTSYRESVTKSILEFGGDRGKRYMKSVEENRLDDSKINSSESLETAIKKNVEGKEISDIVNFLDYIPVRHEDASTIEEVYIPKEFIGEEIYSLLEEEVADYINLIDGPDEVEVLDEFTSFLEYKKFSPYMEKALKGLRNEIQSLKNEGAEYMEELKKKLVLFEYAHALMKLAEMKRGRMTTITENILWASDKLKLERPVIRKLLEKLLDRVPGRRYEYVINDLKKKELHSIILLCFLLIENYTLSAESARMIAKDLGLDENKAMFAAQLEELGCTILNRSLGLTRSKKRKEGGSPHDAKVAVLKLPLVIPTQTSRRMTFRDFRKKKKN